SSWEPPGFPQTLEFGLRQLNERRALLRVKPTQHLFHRRRIHRGATGCSLSGRLPDVQENTKAASGLAFLIVINEHAPAVLIIIAPHPLRAFPIGIFDARAINDLL